jgi:predicted acetyltransferase
MSHSIRPIDAAETEAYLRVVTTAMGSPVTDDRRRQHGLYSVPERTLAAFDGDEMVAAGQSVPFALSVPGGADIDAAGIKAIGVLPTHRRRGLLTGLMRRLVDDARDRGEPVSILWPTESAIYPRFGYAPATVAARYRLNQGHAPLAPGAPRRGRVRLVPADKAQETVGPVYEALRRQVPGMSARTPALWDRFLSGLAATGTGQVVVVEDEGQVTGYARYSIESGWQPSGPANEVAVSEIAHLSPAAAGALWAYLLDIDLVSAVSCWHRPPDDPLPWLLAEGRRLERHVRDGMWLRLVDVPAALAARRYATEVDVALKVADPFCPWNEGTWHVAGGPEGGTCGPTSRPADLTLDAGALGAAYLGGHPLAALARAGRVVEHTPGAMMAASRAFDWSPAPWAVTWF